jgi:hypothetical protein
VRTSPPVISSRTRYMQSVSSNISYNLTTLGWSSCDRISTSVYNASSSSSSRESLFWMLAFFIKSVNLPSDDFDGHLFTSLLIGSAFDYSEGTSIQRCVMSMWVRAELTFRVRLQVYSSHWVSPLCGKSTFLNLMYYIA